MAASATNKETTATDPWALTGIDPRELANSFSTPGWEPAAGGAIADIGVYRSLMTPDDTPESRTDNAGDATGDITESTVLDMGIHMDIGTDLEALWGNGTETTGSELLELGLSELTMWNMTSGYGPPDDENDPTTQDQMFNQYGDNVDDDAVDLASIFGQREVILPPHLYSYDSTTKSSST